MPNFFPRSNSLTNHDQPDLKKPYQEAPWQPEAEANLRRQPTLFADLPESNEITRRFALIVEEKFPELGYQEALKIG